MMITRKTVTSKPILPGMLEGCMMKDNQDTITSEVDVKYT